MPKKAKELEVPKVEVSKMPKTLLGFEKMLTESGMFENSQKFIFEFDDYLQGISKEDASKSLSCLIEDFLNTKQFFVTEKDRLKIAIEAKGWECIDLRKVADQQRYTAQVKQPTREKETIWIEHLKDGIFSFGIGNLEIGKIEINAN